MMVDAYRKFPTLKFTYTLFFLVVVVCVSGTTPLGILLGQKRTESRPLICHINDNDFTVVQEAENVVKAFISNGDQNDHCDEFHIHGWKWHTMSLIHEARRLNRMATALHDRHQQYLEEREEDESDKTEALALRTVADYTIDFNMRGLHRIENDVFFPVLRQRTSSAATISERDEVAVTAAISTVLDQLDKDRKGVEALGSSLMKQASIATSPVESWDRRTRAIEKVALNAAAIADSTQAMLSREVEIVIPVVARLFTEPEQKALNNQVIRKLGILDSRLHLVGMHEAIVNNVYEMQLFQRVIPSLPQKLIPRWKRLMYEPRAGALDQLLR